MQAEMTAETVPAPSRMPSRKTLTIAFVSLALIGLGAYGYTTGLFKQVPHQTGNLFAKTSSEESLVTARGAFAKGDINGAITSYRSAISANSADIAARGELGNVYYTAGMMAEAAQAFFDAATQAIEQNKLDVAENLLPAVSHGNPMLASELNDKLFNAMARESDKQFEEMKKQSLQATEFSKPAEQPSKS